MLKADLLATKLHRPSFPATWIRRPHLIRRLNEGLAFNRQITLVSAPAGFGKTTCAVEWVETLEGRALSWLSLDPADDDPGRFFAYLVAALQQVDGELGRELEGVLRSGRLPPAEVISTLLINDLLEVESPFLLVLDDLQLIQDPLILRVLEDLVTGPPPPLHLVLLTREDPPLPLAGLRANNRLTEIRALDLRFTGEDAERFLNEVMALSLPPADVALLEEKTEGWIVGLQLAALALRTPASSEKRRPPSTFITRLSGSHRFILNYLTEQVLDRQPEEIRHFLLQTSILERLNGELCDAVTGRSDGSVLLERLFNANLFLIPLDDEGRWYRYHHLFADLLRGLQSTLPRERRADLHRRASLWYAQAEGEGGSFAGESIRHALAAEEYALAVEQLERHALEMIMQGYAKTVNGWVEAIPAAWRTQSPRTNLAFAWMHLLRGAYAQATPYLERLEAALAESRSGEVGPGVEAEWLVMRSLIANMEGKPVESRGMAERALEIAPEQESRVRSLAYYALAGACQLLEEDARATEAYRRAIRYGRAAESLVAELMSTAGLALLAFEKGRLHLAFEVAAPVSARLEASGSLPPISAVIDGLLGEIHCQWYDLERARYYAQRALRLSTLGGYGSGETYSRVLLSRLAQLEGNLEAATEEIQKAVEVLRVNAPNNIRQEMVAQQVSVYLARDRPAAAEMVLQGRGFSFEEGFAFPPLPQEGSVSHARRLLYNSSLRLLLHRTSFRRDRAALRAGLELADLLVAGALRGPYLLVALEALLLRARLHALLGSAADLVAGREDLLRALALAEPEEIVGLFVAGGPPVAAALADLLQKGALDSVSPEYVARILDASGGAPSVPPVPRARPAPEQPVEPLTDRELEVLHLVAEGLKYKEIAARLFISLNTVRYHIKAIYGKLQVSNRTQAVEAARRLRIL